MTKSKWRLLLGLFSLIAVMSIAVACGDDDDDSGDSGDGGAPDAGDIQEGGEVAIAGVQFQTWDPHFSNFAQDITHFMMVWRGLYHLDVNDTAQPAMADGEPEVTDDGKTYTIKLKSGLKWSDGDDLLAEDFVLGILRTCNPDVAGTYQYLLTAIVGCDDYYLATEASDAEKEELKAAVAVRAVDDTTVEIKLHTAQPTFPIILATWVAFPLPAHLMEFDAEWPGPLENVYNGPYMPDAYTEKASLELVKNPNWSGDPGHLDKITITYIDDLAVATNAFRSGEVVATAANKPELDVLRTEFKEDEQLFLYPGTRTTAIEYQLTNETLSDPYVRLALSQATDRETLVEVVFQGANTPTTSWVPPVRNGLEGGEYDEILGFDPAKAKESLKQAGYENGEGFPELSIVLRDDAANKLLGEFLQAEWKKHLNINVTLDIVDSATRSARFNSKEFELFIGGWQEDYPDPENWFLGQMQTDNAQNKVSVSIPALDEVIEAAQFNTNDEERREQWREAEQLLLEEASGYAPMYHTMVAMLVKSNIRGMVENKKPGDTFVPGEWYPEYWALAK